MFKWKQDFSWLREKTRRYVRPHVSRWQSGLEGDGHGSVRAEQSMRQSSDVKILVVGNPGSTEVRSHLRQIGFNEIDTTENGLVAMAMLRSKRHNVVLSEWQCCDMTGLELLSLLKQEGSLRHTRFALLTGSCQPPNLVAAKEAGAHGIILKPYSLDTLRRKVDLLLRSPAEPVF